MILLIISFVFLNVCMLKNVYGGDDLFVIVENMLCISVVLVL